MGTLSRTSSPSGPSWVPRSQNLQGRRAELAGELDDLQSAGQEADAREQASAKAALQAQIVAGARLLTEVTIQSRIPALSPFSPTQFVNWKQCRCARFPSEWCVLTMRSAFSYRQVASSSMVPDRGYTTVIGDSQTTLPLEIQGGFRLTDASGAVETIHLTDPATIHPRHAASSPVRQPMNKRPRPIMNVEVTVACAGGW